jgi:hypothetical protein
MLPLHRRLLACFRALVWALCLAVPLQAAAVAVRGSQLPAGQQRIGSELPAAQQPAPQAMPEGAHQLAASVDQHPCHPDLGAASADQHKQQQQQPHHQQHKCSSSCAACCIATALPSSATALPQPGGANVLASTPTWATLSCSSPRLERPPRA